MRTPNPHVVVIGGPNGAGKSTAALGLLKGPLTVQEFVDADVIARQIAPVNSDAAAMEAGRIMLRRLHGLADANASFAFETTLASRSFAPWLSDLRTRGYEIDILFLWLPTADFAVARVHDRLARGGHSVPDLTVRRRYDRGLANFFRIYRRLATSWRLYDNADQIGPRLVASGSGESAQLVRNRPLWERIVQGRRA